MSVHPSAVIDELAVIHPTVVIGPHVVIDGEVKKPQTFDVDKLIHMYGLEERVYRLRCVEAWSMVIPWVGFPLGALIQRLEPTSRAKFAQFTTLMDPEQMPGEQ